MFVDIKRGGRESGWKKFKAFTDLSNVTSRLDAECGNEWLESAFVSFPAGSVRTVSLASSAYRSTKQAETYRDSGSILLVYIRMYVGTYIRISNIGMQIGSNYAHLILK